MNSDHVAHLQRMANESWRGSPEHAALTAAIASLSAPQPPAEAQPVVCPKCKGRGYFYDNLDVDDEGRGIGTIESCPECCPEAAPPSAPVGVPYKQATDYADGLYGPDDLAAIWNACVNAHKAPAQQPTPVTPALPLPGDRGSVQALFNPQHPAEAQAQGGGEALEAELIALVAGPYHYHHKMDKHAEREGKAFDRCRELTIQNIRTWCATRRAMLAAAPQPPAEADPFVVRHYIGEEGPTIKGNGFDGLRLGEDREEAEEFVRWINARLAQQPAAVKEALTTEPPQPAAVDALKAIRACTHGDSDERMQELHRIAGRGLAGQQPAAEAQAQGGGGMTECGHSKYDPCHNCEPLDAPPSAPVEVEGVMSLAREWCDAFDRDVEEWSPHYLSGRLAEASRQLRALAQQPAAVDEAMVARFLEAYRDTPGDEAIDADEKVVRRWLTFALAVQQGGAK